MSRLIPAIVVFLILSAGIAVRVRAMNQIVARGEGIVVTEADLAEMRKAALPFFVPTRKALVEATVRTVLFAREAEEEGIACKVAAGLNGFARKLALSRCYIRNRLQGARLLKGAILSYYRVHWRQFVDEKGRDLPLDECLKKQIRGRILAAKRPIIEEAEYRRLCRKFSVVIQKNGG